MQIGANWQVKSSDTSIIRFLREADSEDGVVHHGLLNVPAQRLAMVYLVFRL